ncbi:MAG TPA: hypothetical protein QF353_03780 [Gammaproteobacteria bacterium]|nr:hypothetical protein [Gammaproteobacteria bacterium]
MPTKHANLDVHLRLLSHQLEWKKDVAEFNLRLVEQIRLKRGKQEVHPANKLQQQLECALEAINQKKKNMSSLAEELQDLNNHLNDTVVNGFRQHIDTKYLLATKQEVVDRTLEITNLHLQQNWDNYIKPFDKLLEIQPKTHGMMPPFILEREEEIRGIVDQSIQSIRETFQENMDTLPEEFFKDKKTQRGTHSPIDVHSLDVLGLHRTNQTNKATFDEKTMPEGLESLRVFFGLS